MKTNWRKDHMRRVCFVILCMAGAVGCQRSAEQPKPREVRPPQAAPAAQPPVDTESAPVGAVVIRPMEKMLYDFELPSDIMRWRPNLISKPPYREETKYATKGKYAMCLELDAFQLYPGVILSPPPGSFFNWGFAENLLFDVVSVMEEPFTLYLRVDAAQAGGSTIIRYNTTFSILPGVNHLRVPLKNMKSFDAQLDPARIESFILFANYPNQTLKLYVDYVRLEMGAKTLMPFPNIYLFDFEGPEGTTMQGFSGVKPTNRFVPGAELGFSGTPPVAGKLPYSLDALVDDCVAPEPDTTAQFNVRLTNGRYTVALFLRAADTLDLPSLNWSVKANGTLKLTNTVTAETLYSTQGLYRGYEIDYSPSTDIWEEFVKDHVPVYTFEVDVVDTVLALSFSTCSVHGLVVWPSEHAIWGRNFLSQVQQTRRLSFYRFNYPVKPLNQVTDDPAAPFVLQPVSTLAVVGPDYAVSAARGERNSAAALSISAARGEYEPAALAFRPTVDFTNVRVSVTDLTANLTKRMPASAVDVLLGKLFPRISSGVYSLRPVMLEPIGGQTLQPKVTREFWVEVHVPPNQPPGTYLGTITIEADGRDPIAISLAVNVLPFVLPDVPGKEFALFYGDPNGYKGHYLKFYPTDSQWKAAVALEMQNMREHGINAMSFPQPSITGIAADPGDPHGRAELDFRNPERFLSVARANGQPLDLPVPMFAFYHPQALMNRGLAEFSPEFNAVFIDACRQIVAWAQANSVPVLAYVVDEPREREVNEWNRNFADTMKYLDLFDQVDGARTFIPLMLDTNDGVDYTPIARRLDVVCTHPWESSKGIIAAARELWLYNAGMDRFSYGFHFWKSRANCRAEWAYEWTRMPYNPLDRANATVVYHTPQGQLLSTIQEKWVREGIDDYKYLYLLETTIAAAQAAGRDTTSATALLTQISDQIPQYLQASSETLAFYNGPLNAKLDQWRAAVADEIVKLTTQNVPPINAVNP